MKYILYIASIAVITMFLMYLGIIKEKNLPMELTKRLYKKAENKVIKYLEKNTSITIPEIRELIKNETASVVWSNKKLGITDLKNFTKNLIDYMIKEEKIDRINGKTGSFKIKNH